METHRTLLVWAIFLSLALHVFGGISTSWIPDSWLQALQNDWVKPNESVEIEVVDRTRPEQQFVKSFNDEKEETDPEKLREKARFLSDRLRRYKEELQASMLGETKNSAGLRGSRESKTDFRPKFNPTETQRKELDRFNDDSDISANRLELDQRQAFQHESRPSTIGETLPKDINKGMFNVLNTDYTTFYSFYERFGTMVRFNWARQLERISNDPGLRNTVMTSVNRSWTTEMKVWLRPDGEILKVTVMKPSGIPILDRAHQRTFVDVGLVPNPPKEMVKEDGLISIDVALTVFYTPESAVR